MQTTFKDFWQSGLFLTGLIAAALGGIQSVLPAWPIVGLIVAVVVAAAGITLWMTTIDTYNYGGVGAGVAALFLAVSAAVFMTAIRCASAPLFIIGIILLLCVGMIFLALTDKRWADELLSTMDDEDDDDGRERVIDLVHPVPFGLICLTLFALVVACVKMSERWGPWTCIGGAGLAAVTFAVVYTMERHGGDDEGDLEDKAA